MQFRHLFNLDENLTDRQGRALVACVCWGWGSNNPSTIISEICVKRRSRCFYRFKECFSTKMPCALITA